MGNRFTNEKVLSKKNFTPIKGSRVRNYKDNISLLFRGPEGKGRSKKQNLKLYTSESEYCNLF